MKKFILFVISTLIALPAVAAPTIKAEVNGMVCAFCAKGIEKKLSALPQTKALFVDLKSHLVAVELKDGKNLPIDELKTIIKDAGYDVASTTTVDKTVAEIKAEVEKSATEKDAK